MQPHQRIDHWLEKYPCGPGGHRFAGTGVRMTPTAIAAQPGRAIDFSSAEEITACSQCSKSGWERTLTCELCDHYPAPAVPARVLVLADGTRLEGVPLCDICHVDLIDGRDPRIRIETLALRKQDRNDDA